MTWFLNVRYFSKHGNIRVALDVKKKELETIRQETIAASAVRARAQWLNEGEKPSKYFCYNTIIIVGFI